jgi:hypothetical protein
MILNFLVMSPSRLQLFLNIKFHDFLFITLNTIYKQPIFKKKNINYQKIPSFLHIPKRIWHGYMVNNNITINVL